VSTDVRSVSIVVDLGTDIERPKVADLYPMSRIPGGAKSASTGKILGESELTFIFPESCR